MFDHLCQSIGAKSDPFSPITGTVAPGQVDVSSKVVPTSATLRVGGIYTVNNGDLKNGGNAVFASVANLNTSGSVYFSGLF